MGNDVINVESLSLEEPLVLYNNWTKEKQEKKRIAGYAERNKEIIKVRRKHIKQMDFHKSIAKSKFVFGGNRTGKSVCGAVEAIWYATGMHPFIQIDKACNGWVVSLTRQVQRDVAQAKILQYLPKEWIVKIVMVSGSADAPAYGVIDFIIIRNIFGTHSKIGFKNCEQGRERFQGVSLDYIWFDEEPPENIYDECLLRLLDNGGVHWVTMTPLKGRSWVYDRIYLNKNKDIYLQCFFMSWDDNPYLLEEEKKYLEANLSPDVLQSRKYGNFIEGQGLVFSGFSNKNIIEPFDIQGDSQFYISIDPGYRNPTAVLWIICQGDNIFVVSDYEVSWLTVKEHCDAIKERTMSLGWDLSKVRILIDSAANQKTSACDISTAEQYRQNGIAVDSEVNKNILSGIIKIKSLIKSADGKSHLFIFKNCINLISEIRGYFWGDGEQPKKSNDHTIDALRYMIMDTEKARFGTSKALGILGEGKKHIIKNLAVKRI